MLAHPFDDGTAAIVSDRSTRPRRRSARDGGAYRRPIGAVVARLAAARARGARSAPLPRHPLALGAVRAAARCGRPKASRRGAFADARARALFAGIAAHGMLPLDRPLTAGVGLALGAMCHVAGWPIPRGGAQRSPTRSSAHLRSLGGEVIAGSPVDVDRRAAARAGRAVRSLAAAAAADRRPPIPGAVPAQRSSAIGTAWACSKWTGRSTRRFRGRPPRAGAPARCTWAARSRRSRRPSATRGKGRHRRAAVRAAQPADAVRSVARAGRQARRVGLLPRAARVDGRHARSHRAADRTLRAGLPRPRPRAIGDDAGATSSAQRELRRRRHRRRRRRDLRQFFTRPTWRTYSTPVEGSVPLLGVHAARRRRARHVRLLRGAARARRGLRPHGHALLVEAVMPRITRSEHWLATDCITQSEPRGCAA